MEPSAFTALRERPFVAAIRAATPEAALEAARAVAKGGIRLLEITFTVPDATRVMRALADLPDAVVGCGTALTADQARAALDAGARFVIAPNTSPAVAKVALDAGVMYAPGAYTTTEIVAARDLGAHLIKVYPVGVAGGPAYIRVIRDPLPDVPMMASGGTTLDNAIPFLQAGCIAIGLGAALADPKLAQAGQFDEITRRARAFIERHHEWKTTSAVSRAAV
jgi:2-dehydro-3-deoxyphosphogluconate aldolase / (4S)-4-hydroxy-2-oxoglutarate aldolase